MRSNEQGEHIPVGEDTAERLRPLAERLDIARRVEPFRSHFWSGDHDGEPTLFLDDVSQIPFLVDIVGVEEYQHRARVRADDGDLFVAVSPAVEGYEAYCRGRLGLGCPELVRAEPVDGPLAVARACLGGETLSYLSGRARRHRRLFIHPYMSIGPVWRLAAELASRSAARIEVTGAPPPVTWIANDKALFGEIVSTVLGRSWLVHTRSACHPETLAKVALEMAEEHPRVGLKRTRCASAMGNAVLEARALMEEGLDAATERVRAFLERTQWDGKEEVLVVAWEDAESSPSTQTWIPPLGSGPPNVQGVYEQILEGETKVFVGSRPSTLPEAVNERLTSASLVVARGLQSLGYVGRCSFDFLVLDGGEREGSIKFTECNGRWGGTSIPMHLVDRLKPGSRPPYRAQDFMHPNLVGVSFLEILSRIGDALYDTTTGRGHFIFYNVGPLATSGKLDVIALGQSPADAEAAMLHDLPARLGLV